MVTRQVVGGAALEEMLLDQRPAVFTVAGHAVEAAPAETPGAADVVEHAPEVAAADLVARVVSHRAARGRPVRRAQVGAGRRRCRPRRRQRRRVRRPAGADRPARRRRSASPAWSPALGWRPHHEQVGQTGSRISPDLYIPCGISGAIQHWAGCSSAKNILAINTDAEAPMVTRATYAVIGDLHEVVPAINDGDPPPAGLSPTRPPRVLVPLRSGGGLRCARRQDTAAR